MSEKQLSNKELKELKKKEKAARRAAQKSVEGKDPQGSSPNANPNQQQNPQQQNAKSTNKPPSMNQIKKTINKAVNVPQTKTPSLFAHLTTRDQRTAKLPLNILNVIHPKILELSGKYANYSIVGSINRCRSMLETFDIVIDEHKAPENITFSRSLTSYLSYQIDYLKNSRPLSVTMGNAIRWLKQEILVLSIDLNEDECKSVLHEKISNYIKEKIEYSDQLIIKYASGHLEDNCTVLTFAHSQVLEKLFVHCKEVENKNITVIIIDSRPLFEGKTLLTNLTAKGINCKYYLINSLSNVLEEENIDFVFLGAHAMLSNGRLYSRCGTGLISMMTNKKNIPILVCCESIKFSERIQLDSVTQNELGDYENLLDFSTDKPKKKNFALESFIKMKQQSLQQAGKNKGQENKKKSKTENVQLYFTNGEETESPLTKEIDSLDNLKMLNIMYDLTPADYINKVITELGALPPSSVPVILREYKTS